MTATRLAVPHVVRGQVRLPSGTSEVTDYGEFLTPRLDLDELIWPRSAPGPAFELPLTEIIEFLTELGKRLDLDTNPHLQESLTASVACSSLGARILEKGYRGLRFAFQPEAMWFTVDQEVGREALDGWKPTSDLSGKVRRVRAFPPRLVHILAGNAPGVTAATILRGALTKGVNLLKLPSNDLFTGTAILRTMAEIDPNHPVTQSFSCVYWRGGDPIVEGALFRSQYFDRISAWGGDAAIQNAIKYVAPGFDLVSFDPKVSISFLGREALASDETIQESATAAAVDASLFNQEVCAASRFIYAEGSRAELSAWCDVLARHLAVEREYADAIVSTVLPAEVREEIRMLKSMSDMCDVFGTDDGSGLVVLTDDPVGFHPSGKTVNVVAVPSLEDAFQFVNVATQTLGIYPAKRAVELRDRLAARGMQRIVPMGEVIDVAPGFPHDGFYPLHRFVKWLVDDC